MSSSSLFHEDIVSADSVPAGLFIQAVSDVLGASVGHGVRISEVQRCVSVLYTSRGYVLSSILLNCSDPHTGAFLDPRTTLAEVSRLARFAKTIKV